QIFRGFVGVVIAHPKPCRQTSVSPAVELAARLVPHIGLLKLHTCWSACCKRLPQILLHSYALSDNVFSRRDCHRLRPAQLLALRSGIPCMLLANFPTGCLVANARSSPRSHRAPVQGLIEPATVPRRWNVNTELGHAAADLVDQVVAAGTIGIVGE